MADITRMKSGGRRALDLKRKERWAPAIVYSEYTGLPIAVLVLEAMNLPSLFFVGTVVAEGLRASGRFATRSFLLPESHALGGFFVQQSRLRRTPTLIGKTRYSHGAFVKALADAQSQTGRHLFTGLNALTVAVYLAAFDRLFCQAAGFEKTGGP